MTPARWSSVAKKSKDKQSVGGRKFALRRLGARGRAEAEVLGVGAAPADDGNDRALLIQLVEAGRVVGAEACSIESARARHLASRAELPAAAHRLQRGEPAIPTVFE